MKLLLLHSSWLEFEPIKKAIKEAEEWEEGKRRIEECLVAFNACEREDVKHLDSIAKKAASEIEKVAEKVNVRKTVLYPWVHLVSTPASANAALKAQHMIKSEIKKLDVIRAPFGWYKEFGLHVKGHPLAELSREIGPEKKETGAERAERKVKSEWFIATPSKELISLEDFDFTGHEQLKKFADYERKGSRKVKEEPPHVRLMRKLEIADYEPASDPGNLRFFPSGKLIKELLERQVSRRSREYGASELETPIMYDIGHPAMRDYLRRFPARHYILESIKKDYFLRFSACFGQFLTQARMSLSYKNLPFKLYELTHYSFRKEKRGELVGLRRLRSFSMPDMHTLCKDLKEATREFLNQFKLCIELMEDLGLAREEYETGIRFTKDFWKSNSGLIWKLVKEIGKPCLIERWSRRYAYFDPKFEFNVVDSLGKASALATVQLDHENSKRYGIEFTDEDGMTKRPLILHCSPSGGIERCIYAMLEKAWLRKQEGKQPSLPLWLSPTQVRICPVSDKFLPKAEKLASSLESEKIRVDLDDRNKPIKRKIRDAETQWIPLIVVWGKREEESRKLSVRFREERKIKSMECEKLIDWIKKRTKGKAFIKSSLPRKLSIRPKFIG